MEVKSRNKFGVALKVAIVFIAAFYIARRLSERHFFYFSLHEFSCSLEDNLFPFLGVILLMPLNWILESLKWKLIASTKNKISFKEALQGVLAGVTIGTATPNRVGEFAGRAFMIKDGNRKELLLLSFISSFCQVFVTIVVGIVSYCMMDHYVSVFPFTTLCFLIVSGILFCFIPLWIKLLPKNWKHKIDVVLDFPFQKLILALLISSIRYFVYVIQFMLLFYVFQNYINIEKYFYIITISYFVVTILPTFSFTEVLVRGTVAGSIFENYGYASFDVACGVAILLWIINVAVPSLIGMFFIFKLKFFKTEN